MSHFIDFTAPLTLLILITDTALTKGIDDKLDTDWTVRHKQEVEVLETIEIGAVKVDLTCCTCCSPLVESCVGEVMGGDVDINNTWRVKLLNIKDINKRH